jgi:predicted Zn-dependent protease
MTILHFFNLSNASIVYRVLLSRPPPTNVLPMVNKALALFQARQDFEAAGKLCEEALALDPTCDVAVATLAQLLLQQNKVEEAVKMFTRSAELARTEPELVNALTYEHVRPVTSLIYSRYRNDG